MEHEIVGHDISRSTVLVVFCVSVCDTVLVTIILMFDLLLFSLLSPFCQLPFCLDTRSRGLLVGGKEREL